LPGDRALEHHPPHPVAQGGSRGDNGMSETTTDVAGLLARLEETHKAATPGPWATYEEHGRDISDEGWSLLAIRSMTGTLPDVALTHPLWGHENELAREDAAAIVAAHNHLPALIAAVRAVLALADEQDAELAARGFVLDGRCILPGDAIRSAVAAALGAEAGS
jgi:hypothetical protein